GGCAGSRYGRSPAIPGFRSLFPKNFFSVLQTLIPPTHSKRLYLNKGFRVVPLPFFLLELFRFINQNFTAIGQRDLKPFQRPRRWSFEIDPGLIKSATMAGAFEFRLVRQPIRGTSQMSTDGR